MFKAYLSPNTSFIKEVEYEKGEREFIMGRDKRGYFRKAGVMCGKSLSKLNGGSEEKISPYCIQI